MDPEYFWAEDPFIGIGLKRASNGCESLVKLTRQRPRFAEQAQKSSSPYMKLDSVELGEPFSYLGYRAINLPFLSMRPGGDDLAVGTMCRKAELCGQFFHFLRCRKDALKVAKKGVGKESSRKG